MLLFSRKVAKAQSCGLKTVTEKLRLFYNIYHFILHFYILRNKKNLKICTENCYCQLNTVYTAYFLSFTKLIKSTSFPNKISVGFILPSSGPFSNFKTPLGQTAEQIPQPTQLDLTIFSPF